MRKNTQLLLALAIPLLALGAGCAAQDSTPLAGSPNTTSATDTAVVATENSGIDSLAVTADVEVGGPVISATKSYVAALATYGKSNARFQFDNCSGKPGTINVKKGAKFMIDNRDGQSHQIGIGPKTYTLAGYGFAIVSVAKAGSLNITCDGGGSAHVNVEN